MVVMYLASAVIGGIGTWYFTIASARAGEPYLENWFANAASSSAAVDVLVVALVACIFMVREGRAVGMPALGYLMLVPLTFMIAVAFTFPLFLAWREWHLTRVSATSPRGSSHEDSAAPSVGGQPRHHALVRHQYRRFHCGPDHERGR